MKNRTLNILRGIGSILDIMPERRSLDLSKLMPRETPADMVAKAWRRVGEDISQAMGTIQREQNNQKNT